MRITRRLELHARARARVRLRLARLERRRRVGQADAPQRTWRCPGLRRWL